MNINKREYQKYAKAHAPKSPLGKDCLKAFVIGGFICLLSQIFRELYVRFLSLEVDDASALASITLAAIAILLTSLGVFDNIAKHAGAGTLVPITGFANAIAAPAVEFQTEGRILGTAAKMFTIAGPVIVYGVSASVVYGLIYWLCTML